LLLLADPIDWEQRHSSDMDFAKANGLINEYGVYRRLLDTRDPQVDFQQKILNAA